MLLQIQETTSILNSLADLSPVIAVLVAIIIWLGYKLEKSEKKLEELNTVIRNNEKENLSTLNKVSNTLETVIDDSKQSAIDVIKEVSSLREWLKEKLTK